MQKDVEKTVKSSPFISLMGAERPDALDPFAPPKIPLALIDDKPLTLASYINFIQDASGDYIINPFTNPDELIEFDKNDAVAIKIIVFNVGSEHLGGHVFDRAIPKIKSHFPATPLVLIADCEEPCCFIQAINMGVHGYITTSLMPSVVMAALRLVLEGGIFAPVKSLFSGIEQCRPAPENKVQGDNGVNPPTGTIYFTPRQLEVLEHVKLGEPNKVIAYELGMQECTVKVHMRDIMKKLNATNRTQLVYNAERIKAESEANRKP